MDDLAEIPGTATGTPTHPEEIRANVDFRLGDGVSLRATARMTPAGLVTAGIMVSTIILSVAALLWAARRPRRW